MSDERDQSQAAFAGVLVAGHVLIVLAIVVEVVGICLLPRGNVAQDEASLERLPGPSAGSDQPPAFASARGLSWKSFMRQVTVSEEPGPSRSVSGTGATAVGRR